MSLRPKITDPAMADTLVRALNRITGSMQSVAKYPEITSDARRPKDPEKLLQTAERCKERLEELKLVVKLSFYD